MQNSPDQSITKIIVISIFFSSMNCGSNLDSGLREQLQTRRDHLTCIRLYRLSSRTLNSGWRQSGSKRQAEECWTLISAVAAAAAATWVQHVTWVWLVQFVLSA